MTCAHFRLEVDLHVILATRMLLHLREWAERKTVAIQGDQFDLTANSYCLSEMRFQNSGLGERNTLKVRVQTSTFTIADGMI